MPRGTRFNFKKNNNKRFVSEVGSTIESSGDRRCFGYAQVVRKHVVPSLVHMGIDEKSPYPPLKMCMCRACAVQWNCVLECASWACTRVCSRARVVVSCAGAAGWARRHRTRPTLCRPLGRRSSACAHRPTCHRSTVHRKFFHYA